MPEALRAALLARFSFSLLFVFISSCFSNLLLCVYRIDTHDPLRLVVFEPDTELCPRLTNTGRKRVVGRPRIAWAQTLTEIFCNFSQVSRPRMLEIVSDKQRYHFIVERLCSQTALIS